MYNLIKNPFERKQKGAVSALCVIFVMLAGCFASCQKNEGYENSPVYIWPQGQKYYYAFDEKIPLYEVDNKIVLIFDEKYASEIQQYVQTDAQILITEFYIDNQYCILITAENVNAKALMAELKKITGVKSVNPMYAVESGLEMGVTNEIVVQFKENISEQKINEMHKKYQVEVKEVTELFLLLSVPIDFDALEVANAIQESGLVNFSHPNFIAKIDFFSKIK